MHVNPIPEGYRTITPYLVVEDAAGAIDFYSRAFGATETFRMPAGDKIAHAELRIGDSMLMLSDEWPEHGFLGPRSRGGATSSILLYVEDVDSAFARAIEAGGTEQRPVEDQFYGDRSGTLADPFGHIWSIATHVRDVGEEEMRRAMETMAAPAEPA
jgi:PhnB protein